VKRKELARIGRFQVRTAVVVGLPKCPHCGALLTSWLLHIAVASGNCGMCGESIETEER